MSIHAALEQYIHFTLLSLIALFIFFVVLVELKTEFENTKYYPVIKVLFGVPFLIADCLMNWVFVPLFLDLPAHPFELVTGRMTRYKKLQSNRPWNLARLKKWR